MKPSKVVILIFMLFLFDDFEFNVFRHGKKFRVKGKDRIVEGWHSWVDVQAVSSVHGSLRYLSKYLTNCVDLNDPSPLAVLTLALCWHYKKRAFCISGDFRKLVFDLLSKLHNSKVAVCVDGVFSVVERPASRFEWRFLGFLPSDHVSWRGCFHRLSDEELEDITVKTNVYDPFANDKSVINWIYPDYRLEKFLNPEKEPRIKF
jgi:hypothetical protein